MHSSHERGALRTTHHVFPTGRSAEEHALVGFSHSCRLMARNRRLAAIDIGTNSIHMIIVEALNRGFRVIDREKEMVQLGRGSLEGRPLTEDAMARAVEALTRMAEIARRHAVDEIHCVATSAVREAPNGEEFAHRARAAAAIGVRVIQGDEEADYIWRAVVGSVDLQGGTSLCVDIGGGSMELIVGNEDHIAFSQSRRLGSLRLTQRFFRDEQKVDRAIEACRRHVRRELRAPIARIRTIGFDQVIGTSGTIVTLAKLSIGQGELAAGLLSFERAQLAETIADLARLPAEGRASAYDLDPRRAETILAGGVLLDEVLTLSGAERMVVTTAALREGIVMRALDAQRGDAGSRESVRRSAVLDLAERSHVDLTNSRHVERLALELFDDLLSVHRLGAAERELLGYAALLREIGQQVSWERYHKHTYYMIRHAGLPGFTEAQLVTLASVARFHRKAKPSADDENLSALPEHDRRSAIVLSAILRVSHAMDRSRRQSIEGVAAEAEGDTLTLRLQSRDRSILDLPDIEKAAKYLTRVLGLKSFVLKVEQFPGEAVPR